MKRKEKNIKDRLLEFLAYLNIGQTKFEEKCTLSRGLINKMTDGIGSDKILNIHRNFPELNIEWLLTGVGDMIKPVPKEQKTVMIDSSLLEVIESQQRTIEKQQATIHELVSKKENVLPEENAKCADASGSGLVK